MNAMLGVKDVCEMLNVHRNTLEGWIRAGQVKAVKVGRRWKIEMSEVERIRKEGINLE